MVAGMTAMFVGAWAAMFIFVAIQSITDGFRKVTCS
jgi:hypothetical protein